MNFGYKQRLFLYFSIIFTLFSIGVIIFEQSRERSFKTDSLKEKLDAYTEIVNSKLAYNYKNNIQFLDSLVQLFPPTTRLSLINKQGEVLYDNSIKNLSVLGDHTKRPELTKASRGGTGYDIRTSVSNNQEYLYYAKDFGDYYIRVALPYDIQIQNFLKSDNLFLYYILALFIVILSLMNFVSNRFGKSIKQLRDFVMISDKDSSHAVTINFPDDELGEIGAKIAENYKQLKVSKKKISSEREKLLQHVHSSGEGLCFFSADKKVEFYNGLFIQYFNTIVDEANSDPTTIFRERSFKELNDFLLQKTTDKKYFEMQIKKQGKVFSVWVNIFEDNGFEIILNDITKHEKMRLLKQEITGNIAHELRTPVTSIRGYLETVLEQQSLDTQKQRHFLTQAYNQTMVLSELIQDMGLITKIEEAPQSFQMEKVNIVQILTKLKGDLLQTLQEKGIDMEWNIPKNLTISGNKNLIHSIFRNLTDNAIRYAGNNIKVKISKYNEDDSFYYFSFSDTGVGIPDENHLNRLFERFYRINEGRTRDSGGTGLGLAIVKNAIAFHKGSIVAKNRAGGGLEFLFKLKK